MTGSAGEDTIFLGLIDGLVVKAIKEGKSRFDNMLRSLPGVYPSIALESLRRLATKKEISEKILFDARRYVSNKTSEETLPESRRYLAGGSSLLPVPHPLDYSWRFGDKASDYLLKMCLEKTGLKDHVVLLGAPSVLARAIEIEFPPNMVLLERDTEITNSLGKISPKRCIINCDITGDELPRIMAKAVVCDPPWYIEYIKSFLWSARQLIKTGGHLLMSLPPIGIRPHIKRELKEVLEWAELIGFRLLRVDCAVLPYVSPPFERNALRAEGFYNIPLEWRRGDLASFVLSQRPHVPRPPKCLGNGGWGEEVFHGVRIRFRNRQDVSASGYPTLRTIVPGDILPSVSRRDCRRRLADVWTSGNRIFGCDNPHLLSQIAKTAFSNQLLMAKRVQSSKISLSRAKEEINLRALRQIQNVINIERAEY